MSIDFNMSIFGGRLTDDPLPLGNSGCRFDVASNERYRNKAGEMSEKTTYMTITCWDRLADLAMNRLSKGSQILVEGKIEVRKVETDEGPRKYYSIRAKDLRFIDKQNKKPDNEDSEDFEETYQRVSKLMQARENR